MKQFVLISAMLFAISPVHAECKVGSEPPVAMGEGFYTGFMLGPGSSTAKPTRLQAEPGLTPGGNVMCSGRPDALGRQACTVLAYPRSNQWLARIFMGYQFNEYAGFEVGYNQISSLRFEGRVSSNSRSAKVPTCGGAKISIKAIDLVGKAILPIYYFNVFAKGGVAYTRESESRPFSGPRISSATGEYICGTGKHTTKFRPVVGIGVSYNLSQSWVIDASANQFGVGGRAKRINYFAVGFSYHIVNRYCGQFLCDD